MNEQMQLAKFLAANAYGFHHVAKLIAKEEWLDANEGRFDPWPLFYTNLGYAIELYLKAYIAFRGGTKAELENDIRHDLKRALKRALETQPDHAGRYGLQADRYDRSPPQETQFRLLNARRYRCRNATRF